MPENDFDKVASNFIEITLRHGCSPVNLLQISRTPFPKNTSGRLLLLRFHEENVCLVHISYSDQYQL